MGGFLRPLFVVHRNGWIPKHSKAVINDTPNCRVPLKFQFAWVKCNANFYHDFLRLLRTASTSLRRSTQRRSPSLRAGKTSSLIRRRTVRSEHSSARAAVWTCTSGRRGTIFGWSLNIDSPPETVNRFGGVRSSNEPWLHAPEHWAIDEPRFGFWGMTSVKQEPYTSRPTDTAEAVKDPVNLLKSRFAVAELLEKVWHHTLDLDPPKKEVLAPDDWPEIR